MVLPVDKKKIVYGENFFHCAEPGSMGIYTDVVFVRCYWPLLDAPTALFDDRSSGIEVQGPPTPRNVVFPLGTVFRPQLSSDNRELDFQTNGSCMFARVFSEREVTEMVPTEREMEVAPGVFVTAKFDMPTTMTKEVEIMHALDMEQAAQVAGVDRDAIVLVLAELPEKGS